MSTRKNRDGRKSKKRRGVHHQKVGSQTESSGKTKRDHDLYNVTEEITDHVTDRIFDMLVDDEDSSSHLRSGPLTDHLNDEIEKAIRDDLVPGIARIATRQINSRLYEEFKEQYHAEGQMETFADKGISGARWIMAAVYMLLALTLCSILLYTAMDVIKITSNTIANTMIFIEVGSLEPQQDSLNTVIAPTIKLLDLVLIGSLVVMVLIGGYENTVSRIGMKHSMPVWLGKLTISELKVKVSASIVIISSIHLLMEFLRLEFPTTNPERGGDPEYYLPLLITSLIHLVFIFSAMAITHINKMELQSHLLHGNPNKFNDNNDPTPKEKNKEATSEKGKRTETAQQTAQNSTR